MDSWCRECLRKAIRLLATQRRVNNPGLKGKESREYYKKHPERCRAWQRVDRALKLGKIKKLPCEVCGENRKNFVHAHHDDYSKPLEVRWLCAIHHKQAHRHK